jgi:hypothetical protein
VAVVVALKQSHIPEHIFRDCLWAGVASSSRAIVGCRKARRYLKSNTTDDDFRSGAHYSDVGTRSLRLTYTRQRSGEGDKSYTRQRSSDAAWCGGRRPRRDNAHGRRNDARAPRSYFRAPVRACLSKPIFFLWKLLGWSTNETSGKSRALRSGRKGWRPGSGDGGRLPWSSASSQPASASDPRLGWGGRVGVVPAAILRQSLEHQRNTRTNKGAASSREGRGGVGWPRTRAPELVR